MTDREETLFGFPMRVNPALKDLGGAPLTFGPPPRHWFPTQPEEDGMGNSEILAEDRADARRATAAQEAVKDRELFIREARASLIDSYEKKDRNPWSRHEFYGVIKEEFDEVWDAIKDDLSAEELRGELVQVVATCMRFIETGDRYASRYAERAPVEEPGPDHVILGSGVAQQLYERAQETDGGAIFTVHCSPGGVVSVGEICPRKRT